MTNPTLERAAISVQEVISDAFFDCVEPDPKDIARAVLMAVREPDEAARDAGEEAFASALHKGGSLPDATLSIHQAMIDAILAEGE